MGAEQVVDPAQPQRVDDEHVRRGRVVLGRGHDPAGGQLLDALQRAGQRPRHAADLRPQPVGRELAGARDRHLHQGRGQGREDHRPGSPTSGLVRSPSREPPKKKANWPRKPIAPGDGGGDGHGQRVAVLDVGELVRDHAGQLVAVQALHQAAGHGDRAVVRVAAGGEGVGLVGLDQVDRRASAAARAAPAPAPARRAPARDARVTGRALCMRSTILSELHQAKMLVPSAISQRDQRPAAAAEQVADGQEQGGHGRQQQTRARDVHGAPLREPTTPIQVVVAHVAAKMPAALLARPAPEPQNGCRTRRGDEAMSAQDDGLDGVEQAGPSSHVTAEEALELHSRGPPGQDRDHAHQAAHHRPRPVARLLARRRGALPRDPEGSGRRLRLHRARQPGGRDLQRHRRAGPGQSRRAGLQAGDGGQGRPVQALRRHRRHRPRGRHHRRRRVRELRAPARAPPSAASTSRTSRRRNASSSSSACAS